MNVTQNSQKIMLTALQRKNKDARQSKPVLDFDLEKVDKNKTSK